MNYKNLKMSDPAVYELIRAEEARQHDGLEMIPSENYVSPAVLDALGSILTNKYSEGYPDKRYYGGCEVVDQIENLARDRAMELFGVTHANVQPYSGSPANLAVCFALLEPGETLMGMALSSGGHMTHGLKVNFSGIYYQSVQYTARPDGYIDLDQMRALATEHKPKLIIVGGTAYPRVYEWANYKAIADEVGAYLVADISHVAGLIVGGVHPSPVGIADVMTTTTHKTLRGPRGAMILCNGEPSNFLKPPPEKSRQYLPTMIDRAIIPGLQGGPHNHQTAAIAVALDEAAQPGFQEYAAQVVTNAQALAERLLHHGFTLVTGGTDNHLLVVDLTNKGVTGKQAEDALGAAGITVNKNTIPHDPRKPYDPSGIRLGTPPLTTRGMTELEMKKIADWINQAITEREDGQKLAGIKADIKNLAQQFPVPGI